MQCAGSRLLLRARAAKEPARAVVAASFHKSYRRNGQKQENENSRKSTLGYLAGGGAVAGLLATIAFYEGNPLHAKEAKKEPEAPHEVAEAGHRIPGLKEYTMEEVNQHDDEKKGVWVSYKNGVYDITDFIPKHPGAKNVMMAAGGSVEPFWEIYAVHKGNAQVFAMLEEYRIGNLNPDDVERARKATESQLKGSDPFANEPRRNKRDFLVHNEKPFNAETPLDSITDNMYTPNEKFFVRNHLPVPDLKADEYELDISGIGVKGEDGITLSLDDLKKFPKHTVTSTIQCGGNRRAEMLAVKKLKGIGWKGGAIGNAQWSGARLYDVLKAAGLSEDDLNGAQHVQFEGYDVGPDGSPFGASIPIEKGFSPYGDVLLAYEMNGEPIPRDHGYPIRVVVPGVLGARNVKWLNRIIVSDEESQAHWQQNDYKGFSPSTDWDTVDWAKSPAIQAMPVTSSICKPAPGSKVRPGEKLKLKGYAYSGGGSRIVRVDITADQGKTWITADLNQETDVREPRHYGWTIWEAEVQAPKSGDFEVWSKAVDSNYNVQPESFLNIWNLRGVLSSAYCKIKLSVK